MKQLIVLVVMVMAAFQPDLAEAQTQRTPAKRNTTLAQTPAKKTPAATRTAASSATNTPAVTYGLRFGLPKHMGITVQAGIGGKSKLEGLATLNKTDLVLTGLYEYHQPLKLKGVSAYFGGGAHTGIVHNMGDPISAIGDIFDDISGNSSKRGFWGLDAIAGLQYNFKRIPFNVSLDVKPAYHFGDAHPKNFDFGGGLSIRWSFGSGGGKGSGNGTSTGPGGYPYPQTGPQPSPNPSPAPNPQPTTKPKPQPNPSPTPNPNPKPGNESTNGDSDKSRGKGTEENGNTQSEGWD